MVNYKKMYAVLCSAIDHALEDLEKSSTAAGSVKILQDALLEAEEIYIASCDDACDSTAEY